MSNIYIQVKQNNFLRWSCQPKMFKKWAQVYNERFFKQTEKKQKLKLRCALKTQNKHEKGYVHLKEILKKW